MSTLAEHTYRFRSQLQEQGVIFCYSGYMTEDVLLGMGNAIKRKLEVEEADRRTIQSLFSVFVEQVQNVIRYSAEGEPLPGDPREIDLRYGILMVGTQDDRYFVSCGNLIRNEDVGRLNDSLTHIQGLDKDELKALYKRTLKGEAPEGSKGAGVGFIDIARRATNGFDFDFMAMDNDVSYFCIKAFI